MRRADYMASVVKQLGKLSTDALKYLDQWSFPFGVIPILRAYDEGELLRRVDCDMEVALAMEEIVFCRDCVHYKPYRTHKHGMMNRCHDEHGHTHKRDENDFCSRGERRSE